MTAPYRIEYSPRALSELAAIYAYIAQDSVQNADAMIERIAAAVARLETFPHRNIVQDAKDRLSQPARSLPVPPYMVFFRVQDDQALVRITRIRHGALRRLKRFE